MGAALTTHSCVRYPSLEIIVDLDGSVAVLYADSNSCRLQVDQASDTLHCTAENESMHTFRLIGAFPQTKPSLCFAGQMQGESNWAAIPAECLRRAFELQQNGLANCAAATTCGAWHEIARGSCINSLYLHADTDKQEQCWHSLLAGRPSIDSLRLVRSAEWSASDDWCTVQRSDLVAKTTMDSIPTACRSLTLSEFCAHDLGQYVGKCPGLKELSIQWNGLPFQNAHKTRTVPDLTALHSLTDLTVQMRNDVYGDMFPALVKSCPGSLQRLSLEGFGSDMAQQQAPYPEPPQHSVRSLNLLECHLPALTHLSLTRCTITIPGEDITCLTKLKSLSLKSSDLYIKQLAVETLTNLTYLDLSKASCYWEDPWAVPASSFTSWPGLEVLDLTLCNMVGWNTVLNVASVQELHIDLPTSSDLSLPQQLHARIDGLREAERFTHTHQSQVGDAVVDLHIDVYHPDTMTELWQVIQSCPNVQSLHVVTHPVTMDSLAQFSEFRACTSQLTFLSLEGYTGSKIDLQALMCLTCLHVKQIGPHGLLECVKLPPGLAALTFIGSGLFQAGLEHNLHSLDHLSRIVFGTKDLSGQYTADPSPSRLFHKYPLPLIIPQLPPSLIRLSFEGSTGSELISDWSGLHACANLEHLTLSRQHWPTGYLQDWIRSAYHLHVVDHEDDGVGMHKTRVYEGTFRGTRLHMLESVPDWLDDPHLF